MLLLSTHGFLAVGTSTTINANVCVAPVPTTLTTSAPSPTALAAIPLAGTAAPSATVAIRFGSTVLAVVSAAPDGSYGATVPLDPGINTLIAAGVDGCGHSTNSPPLVITRLLLPPAAPVITSPADGAQVSTESVQVSGSAEPLSTITIRRNGVVVATTTADSLGGWLTSIQLASGVNVIDATAANAVGPSSPSVPHTVTYAPATPPAPPTPLQPVTPTPASPNVTTPTIISPASGATTAATSILVVVRATPGDTVTIYRNGKVIGSMVAGSDGQAQLLAPMVIGANQLQATASNASGHSGLSAGVLVTAVAAVPNAPVITSPADHTTSYNQSISVQGTANPGQLIQIWRDGRKIAEVLTAADGSWAVTIVLKHGTNTITARVITGGGNANSAPIDIVYPNPVPSTVTPVGWLQNLFHNLGGAFLTLLGLLDQLLAFISQYFWLAAAIVLIGLAGATAADGLVGFEILVAVLVWLFNRLLLLGKRRSGRLKLNIIDSVTEKPLALAWIWVNNKRHQIVTGPDGLAQLELGEGEWSITATHPQYKQLGEAIIVNKGAAEATLTMQPTYGSTRDNRWADLLLGACAWLGLLLGTAVVIYNAAGTSNSWLIALSVLLIDLCVVNLLLLATQPRLHWGQAVGQEGTPIGDAEVSLYRSNDSALVSRYRSDADGHYTVHAPPGEYVLKITAPGYRFTSEIVSINRRSAFFGFRVTGITT